MGFVASNLNPEKYMMLGYVLIINMHRLKDYTMTMTKTAKR